MVFTPKLIGSSGDKNSRGQGPFLGRCGTLDGWTCSNPVADMGCLTLTLTLIHTHVSQNSAVDLDSGSTAV